MSENPISALSVVVPVFNEEESLPRLMETLTSVLGTLPYPYEIILVNDGSTDNSLAVMRAFGATYPQVKVVDFRRNYGQTAALMAGIDHATNDVVVMIDADLQNDPTDIPRLLAKLDEGYDVVSGWRKDRKDAQIRRNWISRVANRLISRVSGVKLNDYGCTLKAYRRSVVSDIRLYGEMHRFIPIYAQWQGARITKLSVTHHAREFGTADVEDTVTSFATEATWQSKFGVQDWTLGAALLYDELSVPDVAGVGYRYTVPGVFAPVRLTDESGTQTLHVDGGIADLVPIAGAAGLSPTRVFVLDASVPPRMPHARTPVEVLVASLGVAMRARPMVDLGPSVEVHHLRTPDLGTRMTDFSRTAEHLALGRRAAAELLDRLAHGHDKEPARPTPRHARHHRLRDIFGRAA